MKWRYRKLNQLDIHFEEKLNSLEKFKIATFGNKEAVFYKGIIFTGPFSKGQALLDFLKVSNIFPKQIIVFDNRKAKLDQIEYYLRTLNVQYRGINYLGITQIKGKQNAELIKFQQDTLLKQGKWLEDDEALGILKSKFLNPIN